MKVQIVLPLSLVVSVAAFALMKLRAKELVTEEKKVKLQDVKMRVTDDVLAEYVKEKQNVDSGMEKEKTAMENLQKAMTELNVEGHKTELNECKGALKKTKDEITSVQEQAKKFQAASAKEKSDWEAEMAALKKKLEATSPICNYVKAGSSTQGLCPEKKEEPKVEPQKPAEEKKEENKPEAPKPNEAKPDAPKAEAPKAEAPKAEAPKAEAPKQEEPPKAEAPKQAEPPKAEAPKQAEPPKAEAPKQAEPPKAEAPKQAEPPKPEAPKQAEPPKPEAPKQDAPKQ